jgi:two-component system, NarL family, invasion response regulator UvrY
MNINPEISNLPDQRKYSILIADDHPIVRHGLRLMIGSIDSEIVLDEALDGKSIIAKLKSGIFDLLILDINMPHTESFSLSSYLLKEFPSLRILIFTMNTEVNFAMRFLKIGVHGYLLKESAEQELGDAIRAVMTGETYISSSLSNAISAELIYPKSQNPFDRLSDRELELTLQILKGYSVTEIAATLHLNTSTVGTHRSRIMKKLGVAGTIELIRIAQKHHII